jgi:Mitochondrial carrier protein
LLGEADNATITAVQLVNPTETSSFRTSSRRGGGFSYDETPTVTVQSPPPLGDKYRPAKVVPIMEPTSRVLRIVVTDCGEGYTSTPVVTVVQNNGLVTRQCLATAVLDRQGHVESIFVLDPGFGYGGGRRTLPPKVIIDPPKRAKDSNSSRQSQDNRADNVVRGAKAYAKLEYKVAGLRLLDGGNGFVWTEPPAIQISSPNEDPDWYIDIQDSPTLRMVPVADADREPLRGAVAEMRSADGNIAYSLSGGTPDRGYVINDELLERVRRDPLELLPSSARVELCRDPVTGQMLYCVPQLAAVPQFVTVMSPRYRAFDPIFGGVGRLPVTKGANALTVSEYARLALSGAVCTVAVRTTLNPLELIKTKQQLQNDDELYTYAREQLVVKNPPDPAPSDQPSLGSSATDTVRNSASVQPDGTTLVMVSPHRSVTSETSVAPAKSIGTIDLLRSIVELRGPQALFQSADITFLASLVFGSFGFGATELFRRSFTEIFRTESAGGSATGTELVLLLAASLATVITALAASPFEVLRVRSMGLVESKKWTTVLEDFLVSSVNGLSLVCHFHAAHATVARRRSRRAHPTQQQ